MKVFCPTCKKVLQASDLEEVMELTSQGSFFVKGCLILRCPTCKKEFFRTTLSK